MATKDVGLVTTLRSEPFLLMSKENASLAPPNGTACQLYMLQYHRDRLFAAAKALGRTYPLLGSEKGVDYLAAQILGHLKSKHGDPDDNEPLKIRVLLSSNGNISVSSSPVASVHMPALFPNSLNDIFKSKPAFRIFISPIQSTPTFHTRYKSTDRSHYDKIRSVLPRTGEDDPPAEILLVNKNGDIMEGSVTTPYFNHSGRWITPAESCGGNLGTTRRWALEKKLCEEGYVNVNSIQVGSLGERVVLSNGVRGFGWGRVEPLLSL